MRDFVDILRLGRAHGLQGEIWADAFSDDPERLLELGSFWLEEADSRRELRLAQGRLQAGRLLLRFEGVAGREQAAALTGRVLQLRRRDLPPLAEDEVFLADLMGLEAVLEDGRRLGIVRDVLELPAGPVLEISDGVHEGLVPFRREFVPEVDLNAGRVVIRPLEGLLPEGLGR
jgi:16S rRNA processing protein RimM